MPDTYKTKQGQMWDEIARLTLGNEKLMHHLLAANPEHRFTVFFSAGTELKIPTVKTDKKPQSVPPWKK